MNNQIIQLKRIEDIDDLFLPIVNESHDRYVREQQKIREREIRAQQMKVARRIRVIETLVNNLFYAALGAAAAVVTMTFLL